MPLAGGQVASESILVQLSHGLWHKYGQRFPNQFRRFITNNPRSGGIRKQDCTVLVHTDYGITRGFDNDSIPRFTVAACGFFQFLLGNILDDREQKWLPIAHSRYQSDVVTYPN